MKYVLQVTIPEMNLIYDVIESYRDWRYALENGNPEDVERCAGWLDDAWFRLPEPMRDRPEYDDVDEVCE